MRVYFLITFFIFNISLANAQKTITYVFLREDCVICQSYSTVITSLAEQYKDVTEFVAVFPNKSSRYHTIDSFMEKYKIPFKYKTDHYKGLTKKFNASVTPEVVVVYKKTNEVIYKGRIDDEFYDIGKRRRVVTNHELSFTLEQLASGNKPIYKETKSIGCFIE
jgi:thioredoxin-related protein